MALSALIHKTKSVPVATVTVATQDTETPATVAKVATVTVANIMESKNPELLVTVWTPAGNPMQVQARDAEHAAFLLRMNPKPAQPIEDR
jgi:hypothetical protein